MICDKCHKGVRECWCFAEPNAVAENGCQCDVPNAGLPLTGMGICQVCGKEA